MSDQVIVLPVIHDEASYDAPGELYNPFNSYWNQLTHGLAVETISKYLDEILPGTASPTPRN